ncbi:MAG: ribose 5-phosphate isomerase B [Candidatus Velthaea sp.]
MRKRVFVKIAVAADHAGFAYKDRILTILAAAGHEAHDFGTCDGSAVDYPDYGFVVGEAVASGAFDRGIVVCGSSIGISIAANKVPGVRSAPVFEPFMTELARRHNDINVLALSERLTGWEMTERLLQIFLETPFEGGRHAGRVAKLGTYTAAEQAKARADLAAGMVHGAETPARALAEPTTSTSNPRPGERSRTRIGETQ